MTRTLKLVDLVLQKYTSVHELIRNFISSCGFLTEGYVTTPRSTEKSTIGTLLKYPPLR